MSAIVKMLTEEAARMRRFPGIGFRGTDANRRAWLTGAAIDVWMVIEAHQDFKSIERMAAESDLEEAQIRLALAYWEQYPDEINEVISQNRMPIEEARDLYPFIQYLDIDDVVR